MSSEKTLLSLSRGLRRYLLLAALFTSLTILVAFLSPQLMRFAVDSVIGGDTQGLSSSLKLALASAQRFPGGALGVCALGMVLCAIVSGCFNFLSRMALTTFNQHFLKKLRSALYSHIQQLPLSWHLQNRTGDLLQRCTSDVEMVREFIAQFQQIFRATFTVVISLSLMLMMDRTMALAAALFIPPTVFCSTYFFNKIRIHFERTDRAESDLTVAVQENLTGVRVVRAFGRERSELDKFEGINKKFSKEWMKTGNMTGWHWGIGDLVTSFQVLTVVVVGCFLAVQGTMTLGEFLVFVSYNQALIWPLRALGRVLSSFSKARVSASRIHEIFSAPPEADPPEALAPDLHCDIEFKNVTFSYSGQQVLKNLSFRVKQGERVGIVGATGSGKSTIACLLNRLYELPEDGGDILFGGVSVKKIARSHLRRNVGLVLQNPYLFSKSIRDNIAIATPSAPWERIRLSAQIAAVDETIRRFPDGYGTVVGERGVTLSGGQKQRVAIARTLTLDSPILVFDDSMSALDAETDREIQRMLAQKAGQITTILISHRISTLMHADQILVLQEGEIAESGSHRELLERGGLYRRLYETQQFAQNTLLASEPEGVSR